MSTLKRSLAKSISWRLISVIDLSIIIWFTTGDIKSVGYIAVFHGLIQTLTYFIHERAWNAINWGKESITTP